MVVRNILDRKALEEFVNTEIVRFHQKRLAELDGIHSGNLSL